MSYICDNTPNLERKQSQSEEVGHVLLEVFCFGGLPLDSVENLKVSLEVFGDVEDGGHVTTTIAVVRCGPNCNQARLFEPVLEPIIHKLVSTCDKVKIVDMGELFCDILAEGVTSSSW